MVVLAQAQVDLKYDSWEENAYRERQGERVMLFGLQNVNENDTYDFKAWFSKIKQAAWVLTGGGLAPQTVVATADTVLAFIATPDLAKDTLYLQIVGLGAA